MIDDPTTQAASLTGPASRRSGGAAAELARRRLFVISLRCGRLANRLSLFATFVALAEEHGDRVINFTFHSYAHLFESTRSDIYCQYPPGGRRSWLDRIPGLGQLLRFTRLPYHAVRTAGVVNEQLALLGSSAITLRERRGETLSVEGPEVQARIGKARLVFVIGFRFRAPDCLRRHAAKVRAYFRPMPEHEQASRRAVERLRQKADVVVGVHIRHGDYRNWRGGKYFFEVGRYAEWMRELARQFPGTRVAFLVCSDEPRDAREFPGLSVGLAKGSPVEDICALAECDYLVGPVSSFTQWASYYGNKPLFQLRDSELAIQRDKFRVCFLEEVPE